MNEQTEWRGLLHQWARNELLQGKQHILSEAVPELERGLIAVALATPQGRKPNAAA